MRHPCGDLTRKRLAFDRDYAVNAFLDIEWDDHPWNSRAASSLSCSEDLPLPALLRAQAMRKIGRDCDCVHIVAFERAIDRDVRHFLLHRQTYMPNVDTPRPDQRRKVQST